MRSLVSILAVLTVFVLAIPGQAAAAAPGSGAAARYTSNDFGFAEGAGIVNATLGQRLDGMRAFTGGRAPLLRVDLDWAHVEPCRGCALQWDQLDPVVTQATAKGLGVLLILGYAPGWANGGHPTDKWFPTGNADWTSIVDRTMTHLAGKVKLFEVWNEPNDQEFGDYATDRRQRYWQLAQLAYGRVHAACADCAVLAGGSGVGTPSNGADTPNDSAAWLQEQCTYGVVDRNYSPKGVLYTDLSTVVGPQAELTTGQTLPQSLRSQDGRYQLWLQADGNLVIYRNSDGHPIWATGTTTGATLVNQADGNLVLRRTDGTAVWASNTAGKGPSSLWMQEDGNLVLYRTSDAAVTWSSHSAQ